MHITKFGRWTAVAALSIAAAAGTTSAASASGEGTELRLWGGSSGAAEDDCAERPARRSTRTSPASR